MTQKPDTVCWSIEPQGASAFKIETTGSTTFALRGLVGLGAAGVKVSDDDADLADAIAALEASGVPLIRRWGRVHLGAQVRRIAA